MTKPWHFATNPRETKEKRANQSQARLGPMSLVGHFRPIPPVFLPAYVSVAPKADLSMACAESYFGRWDNRVGHGELWTF
jgi:hypothetical protein